MYRFRLLANFDGQVTKVEESPGRITIKHGPIEEPIWTRGMTMGFRARDLAMLKTVKAGDKIRFDADKVNGQFTVTETEGK